MNEELKQKLTERFEAISAKAECDNEVRDALLKAYLAGAEYGYQYAVEKACEWLKNHSETDYYELIPNANYCGAVKLNKNKMIEDLCKAMEE